jgi:hypothetical protein
MGSQTKSIRAIRSFAKFALNLLCLSYDLQHLAAREFALAIF